MGNKSAEFALIDRYFKDLTRQQDVITGIGDDAAVVRSNPLREYVVATDTLLQSVHFPCDAGAEQIATRALCVNLSDMAAMGAVPRWFTLALTLPGEKASANWLHGFSRGLAQIADQHNVALIGGDTTAGPLTISITLLGEVPAGESLLRSGARPGDSIFVSGTLGDGAAALDGLKHHSNSPFDKNKRLMEHFYQPRAQIELGLALRRTASACIDISDGLLADLEHICQASQVSAEINTSQLPIHPDLKQVTQEVYLQWALTGGDDYQLCFTLPEKKRNDLEKWLSKGHFHLTEIGKIIAMEHNQSKVNVDGGKLPIASGGYDHFQ